jgi:hypothetical protein
MGMEQITQLLLSFLSLRTYIASTERTSCACRVKVLFHFHAFMGHPDTQFEGFSRFYDQLTPAEVDGFFCGKLTVNRLIHVKQQMFF